MISKQALKRRVKKLEEKAPIFPDIIIVKAWHLGDPENWDENEIGTIYIAKGYGHITRKEYEAWKKVVEKNG